MAVTTEADARMAIDKLLEAASWQIMNKAQVSTEEAAADGRADYILKDTRPLAVIEAKRFTIDPYSAKEQAREYAQSLSAPFVVLSNGQEHYFWDYEDGDARSIMGMPSQADLERRANTKRFNDPGQKYDKPKMSGIAPKTELLTGKNSGEGIIEEKPPGFEVRPLPHDNFVLIKDGSLHDEIRYREIIIVGPEGLAIDRKTYQEKWDEKIVELIKSDPAVDKIFRGDMLTDEEWEELSRRLNSPEYYFNETSLRRAFEQPTGSLSDFIRVALKLDRFLTREERIERAFNAWFAEHSTLDAAQAQMLRLLKSHLVAQVSDKKVEPISLGLFSQPPFSLWGESTRMEQLFGKQNLHQMANELNALLAA